MGEKLSYSERKKLARKLFGEANYRPQQEFKPLMYHRRKLNYDEFRQFLPEGYADKVAKWTVTESMLNPLPNLPPPNQRLHPAKMISSESDFHDMMKILKEINLITLDLEGDEDNSYMGMTSLIQIGTWAGRFIVDPFRIYGLIVRDLKNYLEQDDILIVMHGCSNDVRWLKRDFGIFLISVVDVQIVHQKIHRGDPKNYDYLISHYIPEINKTDSMKPVYQVADWRIRPLPDKLQEYADFDVFGLLFIWEAIKKQDDAASYVNSSLAVSKKHLIEFFSKSYATFEKEMKSTRVTPKFSTTDGQLLKTLWEFRNLHAKSVDANPRNLIPFTGLIRLVKMKPNQVEDVRKELQLSHTLVEKSYATIIKIIEEGKEFFNKVKQITCNNCLRTGHAAFSCWEEYSNENTKRFYDLHPELKLKRKQKSRRNYKRNLKARKNVVADNCNGKDN